MTSCGHRTAASAYVPTRTGLQGIFMRLKQAKETVQAVASNMSCQGVGGAATCKASICETVGCRCGGMSYCTVSEMPNDQGNLPAMNNDRRKAIAIGQSPEPRGNWKWLTKSRPIRESVQRHFSVQSKGDDRPQELADMHHRSRE